jgi:multimeric flavodoxin WrbA
MNILAITGSPRKQSNSTILVNAVVKGAERNGATVTRFNLVDTKMNGCIACMHCRKNDGCAQQDDMQQIYQAVAKADAVVIGFPIYMLAANAHTKTFMDRLYPYLNPDFTAKVNKKTVLCIAQGKPDKTIWQATIDSTTTVFNLLGFKVA